MSILISMIEKYNVIALFSNVNNYMQRKNFLLSSLSKIYKLLLVTLNSVCTNFIENVDTSNLKMDNILLLDGMVENKTNVKHIKNCRGSIHPSNLTDISIKIKSLIDKENVSCVIFDTVSALLPYNSEQNVIKFLRDLKYSIVSKNKKLIILVMEENTPKEMFGEIAQIVEWFTDSKI